MIDRIVILGATGDLTARFLAPALARLLERECLPTTLEIVGVAQDDWDTAAFRRHLARAFDRHAAELGARARDAVLSRACFRRADVTDQEALAQALEFVTRPAVVYLALPPAVLAPTVRAISAARLAPGSRIVVEKPFGEDLRAAEELNALVHASFPEDAVFRMDHFLGKQTVQNILGLRFANRILEPVWSHEHIERVEIIWDERIGVEGRTAYYDHTGALRDMVQNHLLQLLALVAMEPPATMSARDLRDRKVEVLRAVRRPDAAWVAEHTARGRYTSGDRPSYVDEPGVDPGRATETFARVTFRIDNWRWSGVPFDLRTGKALAEDRRRIVVHFRPVPHLAFDAPSAAVNRLVLDIDPDRLALRCNINGPGDPFDLEAVELEHELAPHTLPPYARLLLDVIEGDPTLSIRDDEAEEGWRIVEPVLRAWRDGAVPLLDYAAGGHGPVD